MKSTFSDIVRSVFGAKIEKPDAYQSVLLDENDFGVLSGNDRLISFRDYSDNYETYAKKVVETENTMIRMKIKKKHPHGLGPKKTLNGQIIYVYAVELFSSEDLNSGDTIKA